MLKGEPGQEYKVRNHRPDMDDKIEIAEADDNGVLRDDKGRSYSTGVYEIVEEVDDE